MKLEMGMENKNGDNTKETKRRVRSGQKACKPAKVKGGVTF